MNLKVYLRGLGIGIIVTAIIMLVIAGQNKTSLSDSEIRERALALGMVDDSATLTQLELKNDKDAAKEADKPKVTETSETAEASKEINGSEVNEEAGTTKEENEPEVTAEVTVEETVEETGEAAEEVTETVEAETTKEVANEVSEEVQGEIAEEVAEEVAADDQKVTNSDNGEKIAFTVKSGEGSYTVAQHLSEIGLVSNATDFDNYLCRTGLDRRINAGSFSIPASATEEEIANILAGK